jgi:DtxR family Mn-dependent transcriptional regulator
MASSTVEDYLKRIYLEAGGRGVVSMGRLAEVAGVAPGTATAMAKALAAAGLADYAPYSGVRLTSDGCQVALRTLRRHRLVELLLVRLLGMDWSEVHEDAEKLEHAISDRLLERIDEVLGHPETDPHGDPIPTPQGRVSRPRLTRLAGAPLGMRWRVAQVVDQSPDFLKASAARGLRPGARISVRGRDDAAGTVTVRCGRREVVLGSAAAEKILLRPA